MFEGEEDHLIPSSCHLLLECNMFVGARGMLGHSFLHDGPTLCSLSLAIVHVLCGGSAEEGTIELENCVDLDIRGTIKLARLCYHKSVIYINLRYYIQVYLEL